MIGGADNKDQPAYLSFDAINKIMTKDPVTIEKDLNIKTAIEIMNKNKITALFVINHASKIPEGIIHIHDCIKTK